MFIAYCTLSRVAEAAATVATPKRVGQSRCVAAQCLQHHCTALHSGVLQCETLTLQLIDGMRTDGDVYGLLNVPHVNALLISHGSEIGAIRLEDVTDTHILQIVGQEHGPMQLEVGYDGLHPARLQLLSHQPESGTQLKGGGGCHDVRVVVGQQDHQVVLRRVQFQLQHAHLQVLEVLVVQHGVVHLEGGVHYLLVAQVEHVADHICVVVGLALGRFAHVMWLKVVGDRGKSSGHWRRNVQRMVRHMCVRIEERQKEIRIQVLVGWQRVSLVACHLRLPSQRDVCCLWSYNGNYLPCGRCLTLRHLTSHHRHGRRPGTGQVNGLRRDGIRVLERRLQLAGGQSRDAGLLDAKQRLGVLLGHKRGHQLGGLIFASGLGLLLARRCCWSFGGGLRLRWRLCCGGWRLCRCGRRCLRGRSGRLFRCAFCILQRRGLRFHFTGCGIAGHCGVDHFGI
ncbi:hypothetical protein M5D96_000422 [Drosophila gunungcola]|uniref:Uncharacterized protein n=1 Tax=Drosophila gunungcola TaxID=103775 RepID=A0A9Q0BU46_9MUSC|nr:hypothetical protein M5D96_000422 [Drosophila gunungcola]